MATEIELKAWVDDPEGTSLRISGFAEERGLFLKEDAYWRPLIGGRPGDGPAPNLGSGVRIRREGAAATVNFKRKEVRSGMEVNDEREFRVSDADAMGELLSRLGLGVWIRKRKSGRAWDWEGMTIELSEIEGLGTFVELEILSERDDAATVAAARSRLLEGLRRCGVGEDRIEGRYYTEMLEGLRAGTFTPPGPRGAPRSRP